MTTGRSPIIDIADAAMLVTAVIWALNNVLVKVALEEIAPLTYITLRFAIVTALFFIALKIRRESLALDRVDLPRAVICGLTGFTLYHVLFTMGLTRTSAFSVALLLALGPIFILVFAALLKIERVRMVQWIGVAVSALGVALYVWNKMAGSEPAVGDLFSLAGSAIWAGYSLTSLPLVRKYGAAKSTAWCALFGLIGAIPFTSTTLLHQDWGGISRDTWGTVIYSSALSMFFAYTVWSWAINRRGVGRTVPFLFFIPVLTGVIAYFFLDEVFPPAKLLGAFVVFAGISVARIGARSPVTPDAPPPVEPHPATVASRP